MNKVLVGALVVLAMVIVAVGGYMVWNAYQTPQMAVQNPGGTSTNDSSNTTTTPSQAGLPKAQTDSATAPYISTVVVKGTVNPNGAATMYWFEYGLTSSLGTKTKGYMVGSGYANIYSPAYITGLASNTNYFFRLSASNSFGTVHGTTYTFSTNATPNPSGVAPTTTTNAATDITQTTANVHGRVNPNGLQTSYWFEYGTSAQLGAVTSLQSAGSGSASAQAAISLSNLQPLTKYFFRLNAQNQFGTVNGEILNFTTKGPATAAAPVVITNAATDVTDISANLQANVDPNGATTTYWFEYSTNSLLSNVLVSKTDEQTLNSATFATNVSQSIGTLASNKKYFFRVVARNQFGTVYGTMLSFTTKQ